MSGILSVQQGLSQIGKIDAASKESSTGQSFKETIQNAIEQVDGNLKVADQKVQAVNTGQSESLHGTMIAMEKANISLRFMVQMRNKAVDAYKEIMRMQV